MIVVADTSAISNLMAIGREGILRDQLAPLLDELITIADFQLSAEVMTEFLRLAGADGGGGLHSPSQT